MKCLVSMLLWICIVLATCMPVHKHALVIRNVGPRGTEEETGGTSRGDHEPPIGDAARPVRVHPPHSGEHSTDTTFGQNVRRKVSGSGGVHSQPNDMHVDVGTGGSHTATPSHTGRRKTRPLPRTTTPRVPHAQTSKERVELDTTSSALGQPIRTQNIKARKLPKKGLTDTPSDETNASTDADAKTENDHKQEGSRIRTSTESFVQMTDGHHAGLQVTTASVEHFTTTQKTVGLEEPNAGGSTASTSVHVAETSSEVSNTAESTKLDDVSTIPNNSPIDELATEDIGELHTVIVPAGASTQDTTMRNTPGPGVPHTLSPNPTSESHIIPATAGDQDSHPNSDLMPAQGSSQTGTDEGFTELQTSRPSTDSHTSKEEEPITDKSTQSSTLPSSNEDKSTNLNNRTDTTEESYETTTLTQTGPESTTARAQDLTTNNSAPKGNDLSNTSVSATEPSESTSTQLDAKFTPTAAHVTTAITTEPTLWEPTTVFTVPNDTEGLIDILDAPTTGQSIASSAGDSETSGASVTTTMESEALESNITQPASSAVENSTVSSTNGSDTTATEAAVTEVNSRLFTTTVGLVSTTHSDNDTVTKPNEDVDSRKATQTEGMTDVDPIGTVATTVPTRGSSEGSTTPTVTPTAARETTVITTVIPTEGRIQPSTNASSDVTSSTTETASSANDTSTRSGSNMTDTSPHSTQSAETTVVNGNVSSSTNVTPETSSSMTVTNAGISESTSPVTSLTSTQISALTTRSPDKETSPTDKSVSSGTDEHTTKIAGPLTPGSPGSSTGLSPELSETTTMISLVPSATTGVSTSTVSSADSPSTIAKTDTQTTASTAPTRNESAVSPTPEVATSVTGTPGVVSTVSSPPVLTTTKPPRVVIPHLPDVPKPLSPLPLAPRDIGGAHSHLPSIVQPIRPEPLH